MWILGVDELTDVTQTGETLDFARRAPLKRKMEEGASHHLLAFAFVHVYAEVLRKYASGPGKS